VIENKKEEGVGGNPAGGGENHELLDFLKEGITTKWRVYYQSFCVNYFIY
jgi:hypothetical protein